ncbi:MAG: Gfo/Idh/MocA family oxidoreductase [Anaerolineales bacterium]|nr:Gfo/Idh/MocA family oxidoreductase [Anaerolineales bacterium]
MKLAVIGLGGIARKAYMPLLSTREGIELLFSSRSQETVSAWCARYRVARGTSDLNELIDWAPDAAIVLTPSGSHFKIADQLLESGVDVLVEKPITLKLDHTRHLAEKADQHNRILMVAFNRRYAPLHRKAREIWADRKIGLGIFEKHRTRAYHPTVFDQYIDDSIHQIDILRYFCGDGVAQKTFERTEAGLIAGAVGLVQIAGSGTAVVLNELKAAHWEERYTLHGDGASLHVDAFSRLRFSTGSEETLIREDYAGSWQNALEARGFLGVIDHFLACVESRKQPETTAWEALKTQELVEAMAAA